MSSSEPAADPLVVHPAPSGVLASSLRSIRQRLDELVADDEALSAFLLDEFPEVHRELAAGMARTQRVNILFERVEPQKISAALNRRRAIPLRRVAAPRWQK